MIRNVKNVILVSGLVLVIMFGLVSPVLATDTNGAVDLPIISNNEVTTGNNEQSNNQETNNTVANNEVNNTEPELNNENVNNSNTVANGTLPQTGVTEDATIIFFIAICIISAIYAYKKIRDYKNIK